MNQLIMDVCDVDGHFILVTVKPNDTFRTGAKLVCLRSGLFCHTAEVLAKAVGVLRGLPIDRVGCWLVDLGLTVL